MIRVGLLVSLLAATTLTAQLLDRIDPDRALAQRAYIDQTLTQKNAETDRLPYGSRAAVHTGEDEEEDAGGCTLPYAAFVPDEVDDEIDYENLMSLPSGPVDSLLDGCYVGVKGPEHLQAAATTPPKTVKGWRVDTKNLREFRDPTGKLIFQFAPVTSTSGARGVYLGRGAVKVAKGKTTVSWARRVVNSTSFVEYLPRVSRQMKLLGLDWDDVTDFFEKFWKEAKKWIEKNLPKWVSKAIEKIAKELEKWALELLADLLGSAGRSSQIAPVFTAEMGRNDAAVQSLNEYLATVDTVRTMQYSLTDKVFLSLSAPVDRTKDIRAAIALAKTIDQLR